MPRENAILKAIQERRSPYDIEGTGVDCQLALGGYLTDIEDEKEGEDHGISKPGSYILRPSRFSTSEDATGTSPFEQVLRALKQRLEDKTITGSVTVHVPVENADHWRLASVEVKNSSVVSAELWDPCGQTFQADAAVKDKMTTALESVFPSSEGSEIKYIKANRQREANTCLDHVVKHAFEKFSIKNAITQANDDGNKELRTAFVDTLVTNQLKEMHEQCVRDDNYTGKENALFALLLSKPQLIQSFDSLFAGKLSELQEEEAFATKPTESLEEKATKEGALQETAHAAALKEYSSNYATFFSVQNGGSHAQAKQATLLSSSCAAEARSDAPQGTEEFPSLPSATSAGAN